MITGKKTLEMASSRQVADENVLRDKDYIEDAFCLDRETSSPLDDLEFSEIEPETIPLKKNKSPEKKQVVEEKQVDEKPTIKPWGKLLGVGRRKYYSLLALTVTILAIGFYLLATQSYTVETKLVFVVGDTAALDREGWALGRELSILQNPGTGFLLSKRYYQGLDPSAILSSNEKSIPDPLLFKATSVDPSTVKNNLFKNSKDFESWISKSMSFDPDLANGQNSLSIRLTGPDPSLLKGVLQDYVGSYVDLRRVIDARAKANTTAAMPQQTDYSVQEKSIQRLDEKIRKLDELGYEYQLALNLMDSGGGSFSALALDSKNPASTTLTRLQDKIIQLEIERGALENRYTPQSREIKSVDFQIQGVKGLMRQYLVDQIQFVKKDKDLLTAQKNDLEGVTSDTRKSEKPRNLGKLSGLLVNGAKWYLLNDGLSVISEPPSITEKPFIAKLGDAKDAFVSSLFSPSAGRPGPLPSYDQRGLTQYSGQPSGPQSLQGFSSQKYGPVQSNEMYREIGAYSRR